MLRFCCAILLLVLIPVAATAQTIDPPKPVITKSSRLHTVSEWPDARYGQTYSSQLDIVTLSAPGLRQPCHVRELTPEAITCKPYHHRAQTIFLRSDILALIGPPEHENLINFLEAGALVGAALVSSFFVPPLGAVITLRIIAGFLFFGGWAACGEFADQNASDHSHDLLFYQRAGTTLTIHLR